VRASSKTLFADPQGTLKASERARVAGLTWLSYASYYLTRKNFSVAKARVGEQYGLSPSQLGDLDTGYLTAYAVGQFLSGWVGDRLGARRLVGLGMLLSAAACFVCGRSPSAWLFGAAFTLNGLAQSTGWPGNVKAMAAWFRPSERGTVMGVWTTNYQVGGLVAAALATFLLVHHGWRAAFNVPAAMVAAVALAVLRFLPERPRFETASSHSSPTSGRGGDLLRTPLFWRLGTAYFALKLIRYSILFWLPYYLKTGLGYSDAAAGYLSVSFEVGGIIGAICVGMVSDRLFPGKRREVSAVFIAALALALFIYTRVAPLGAAPNFLGMALVGFCLFGPDALISGAAAQDLGGAARAAFAAGAINGMGSLGAILQGRVTSAVVTHYGWSALYYVFVALALAAAVTLSVRGGPSARARGAPSG
jgi:sugar phosphate permease